MKKFGVNVQEGWLPDSFGFDWRLPRSSVILESFHDP
ncbi:TPA: hypothetical protein EYP70_02305 [Candidatus Bathyarchaeota archaeon]|nr:hypothetical protein [Candidatus Bathyarchaeota archaeon]